MEQKQQRETEKQKRQDRKVSGVSFATTLSDKTIHRKTPDLQELTPEDTGAGEAPVPSPFEELVINRPEPESVEEIVPDTPVKTPEPAKKRKTQESAQMVAAEAVHVEETIKAQDEHPVAIYRIPPLSLLNRGKKTSGDSDAHLRATALKLEQTLQNFGVQRTL